MRILIVGATGTIGRAVVAALSADHEIIPVSHKSTDLTVDVSDPASIRSMYASVGKVDAIVSVAGAARFKPLGELTDEDFLFTLQNKLMGQVNLARIGFAHLGDGGSITLTSGTLSHQPMVGSGAISLVNSGLEGFTRAAALEAPRKIRVNVVCPPWITETLIAFGMDPSGGLPATTVAKSYVESVTGTMSGEVIEPKR